VGQLFHNSVKNSSPIGVGFKTDAGGEAHLA